jgi:hypothetical protein
MITLKLPPDVEARLAAEAQARGLDLATYAAQVLEQAAPATTSVHPQRTPEEIRAWLDELAQFSDKIPAMPGETFSREMIYQDHD